MNKPGPNNPLYAEFYHITEKGRVCPRCMKLKVWNDFYKNKLAKTGHQAYCKDCSSEICKEQTISLRKKIFDHYGGICFCCGEDEFLFLQLDHVNNDGAQHRKEIGSKGGNSYYLWIKKNNYPEGYQASCANCNTGKQMNGGICPHQIKSDS